MFNAFLLDSIRACKAQVGGRHFVPTRIRRNEPTLSFCFGSHLFSAVHYTAAPGREKRDKCDSRSCFSSASSSRQWAIEEAINQLLEGILITYRLLFGQNKQVRKFLLASVDLLLDFQETFKIKYCPSGVDTNLPGLRKVLSTETCIT